jgi:hypothetical protein
MITESKYVSLKWWVVDFRKYFLDCSRYRKQKRGRATADLQVTCTKCGRELQGDSRIEFTRDGLVCACCFDGKAKSP